MSERTVGDCKRRCPKCGGDEIVVNRRQAHFDHFKISGGKLIEPDQPDRYGAVTGIFMHCNDCDHKWRARNAADIWDLLS